MTSAGDRQERLTPRSLARKVLTMPANLGWDDSVDGPALCEKLTALSEPDLPRLITESPMIRGSPFAA